MLHSSQTTNEGPEPQARTEAERELERAIAEELKNRKPLPIELQQMLEQQE